ncbi:MULTISPECIES: Ig-like domain-containing protein [unclassified Flavobacterium]|uniref:Ig-like domain-containing protein n=1 Tax=unclassified Flavobacterium TaxID=196869 RepID=UPI00131B162C|nr:MULTISPECIES: Ig-like domain-containing protein [unclassified Flavobacterium]
MKTKNLLLLFAILFFALISGCAEDDFIETVGVCPVVESTIPTNGALNIPFNQIISVTFNEEINASTINPSTLIISKADGTVVSGSITYSARTARFTPVNPLSANTTYTGRITTGVKDVMGNALQTDYVWTFSTGMIIVPVVITTDPTNNQQNVALNKTITATFSIPMDPLTINNSTITVKQGTNTIAGAITFSGSTVSFVPTNPLTVNTVYTITITTAAKSLQGTPLSADYVWNFTTVPVPTVTATDPFNSAIGVDLNKTLTANFSIAMDPLTINTTTFTLRQGTTVIPGAVLYTGGTTASFNPVNALNPGLVYTATITTGAKSLAGIPLASNYVWNFTTSNVVVTPPVITSGLFFGVFGGNAGITNQGLLTVINGAIGTTAAATLVTGFTDGTSGDVYTVTPLNNGIVTDGIFTDAPAPGNATKAAAALAGLNAARDLYNSLSPASMPGGVANPGAGELGGLTLVPGIYTASSSFSITNGNLTLNANGDPNAKWYFQAPSSLTVGDSTPSSVTFLNGVGNPNNVYWYVGTAAVINYAGGGVMVGNIIANSGVTLSSPANSTNPFLTVLNGRAISLVASVTMVNTTINVPTN